MPQGASVSYSDISRRMLLGAGVSAAVLATLGLDFATPKSAFGATPGTSPEGIVAYGLQYLNKTLAQVKTDPDMAGTPWASYTGDWCAWFISWITRDLGFGYHPNADDWDFLPEVSVASAQLGDLARIRDSPTSTSAHHIGIVSQVQGGLRVLDGNRMRNGATAWNNSWVQQDVGYSPMILRRPTYSAASPAAQSEEAMILRATSASTSGLVVSGYSYTNDVGGHWRGHTNLEGNFVVSPLVAAGKLNRVDMSGDDIEHIFRFTGIWEQVPVPANTIWIASINAYLKGLGQLTGRVMYPGASGLMGTWHYPVDEHA